MKSVYPFKSRTVAKGHLATSFGRQMDAQNRDFIFGAPRLFPKRLTMVPALKMTLEVTKGIECFGTGLALEWFQGEFLLRLRCDFRCSR